MRRFAVIAVWLTAGCAGAPVRPDSLDAKPTISAVESVSMSPFYFEGGANGLEVYTDTDLFRRAGDFYDAEDWKGAFNLYRKIIDKFPDSDYRILAYFNAGLCLEQLSDDARAVDYFRAAEELTPAGAALGRDILAHLGAVYEKQSKWREANREFEKLLKRGDINEEERWQFRARALVAATFHDDDEANVRKLESFIEEYARRIDANAEWDNTWLARSRFSLGEVYFLRFRSVKLELPEDKLREDLERKAEALLRAQNQFMRTLQIKNVEWATASVYRIGLGYEEFYHALNSAPVPPDLNEEERAVYAEELRNATEPVRNKAIVAYDRIIRFANRLAIRTDWVEKARQRVVELRTMGRFSPADDAAVR